KVAVVEGNKLIEKYNCVGCHILEPDRVAFRPEAGQGRTDWLKLPSRVTVRGLEISRVEDLGLSDEELAKAAASDEEVRDVLATARVQIWDAPWTDASLQQWFRSGITAAERDRMKKVNALFYTPGELAKAEALKAK